MTEDEMTAIVMTFPGVEVGTNYGKPAFKLEGKFFTRVRREDRSIVLAEISFDEREMLMEAEPATFHLTPHYKDYPMVLARMETLHPGSFRNFLERRFRRLAKKAAVKAWEAGRG